MTKNLPTLPTLPTQIRAAIAARGLTLYGASQIVRAETDEALKTIHLRLTKYTSDSPPTSIRQLEETLDALGYRIELVQK